jgi:hypothetical protein
VGVVGYARSGLPRTTNLGFNDMQIFPDGYYDTGKRMPFIFTSDVFLEYNMKISRKYSVGLNATVSNVLNAKTITAYYDRPNYAMLRMTDDEILAQKTNYVDWRTLLVQNVPVNRDDPRYGLWTTRLEPWSWRAGVRFSF